MDKNLTFVIVTLFIITLIVTLLFYFGFSPGETNETHVEIIDNKGTVIINEDGSQSIVIPEENVTTNQIEEQSRCDSCNKTSNISPETGGYEPSNDIFDIISKLIILILQALITILKSNSNKGE